jgi:tetratricopeptide (TPR) repeat protein
MKKILIIGLVMMMALTLIDVAMAQNTEVQKTQLYRHYQMKYVFGMKYNDSDVAKNALYSMIAMDPNDDSLKMVLCYYYFEQNQFASSLFVSADLLSRRQDNVDALRINAMSFENMGVRDKAIEAYETLYLKTNDIGVLYQVSLLQFEVARYEECKTNLDIIIKNPQANAMKLSFAKDEKEQQEVSLAAACYNMKGMLAKQQGNKEEAKTQLMKALELDPEFALASQNLDELK